MPEFYIIIARKIFFPNLGRRASLPRPSPMGGRGDVGKLRWNTVAGDWERKPLINTREHSQSHYLYDLGLYALFLLLVDVYAL